MGRNHAQGVRRRRPDAIVAIAPATEEEIRMQREKAPAYLVVLRVLFTIGTLGAVCFIFGNSLQTNVVSGARSSAAMEWLNACMAWAGFGYRFSEYFVRKLAHLGEFMLLGFFLMLTLRVYTARLLAHLSWPLFFGLAIPVADESLQLFSAGRSAKVSDILIDFTGVLVGVGIALFLLLLVRMAVVLHRNHALH